MAVWCQDEAGPYQTVPVAGQTWEPMGKPHCQPHEYERNGTAKLLTLFHPASGQVRAKAVTSAANAVRHPWLHAELLDVLARLPEVTLPEAQRPALAQWQTWEGRPCPHLPPLRLILVWDNLAGHLSGPSEPRTGDLALSPWRPARVDSAQWQLAQPGGVTAADRSAPSLGRSASPDA